MSQFYSYITKQNDRWDSISYKFYKTPFLYEQIIKANPEVSIVPVLDAGIKLKIPVIEETQTIKFESVPWKE